MALLSSKKEVPTGAVKLSKQEAINYQWNQIFEWPNIIDVWPFKIGIPSLVGFSIITSLRINNAIRSKLFLRGLGKVITHHTVALGATILATTNHCMFITNKILVYEATCPVCIESKAVLIQLGSSIIYPSFCSIFVNCTLANKYATYRLPYYSDGEGILKLLLKLMLPLRKKLLGYIILNIVAAGFVTYSETMSVITMRTKLLEKEIKMNEAQMALLKTDTSKKTPNKSSNEKK